MSIQLADTRITQPIAYRIGIVANNVPPPEQPGRVRVTFTERDQTTSWWLPVAVQKSQADKQWWFPDIGEQVVCVMDANDEDGVIIGSVYSTVDVVPGQTSPSDLRTAASGASVSPTPLGGSTFDEYFTNAATLCPGLNSALPGVSGKNVLKGLAISESSLNPAAVSQPTRTGSRCWGVMQISTDAHAGYSPDQLINDPNLNIRVGTADICGKMSSSPTFLDAVARYKGWSSYNASASSKAQVDAAISHMQALGTT